MLLNYFYLIIAWVPSSLGSTLPYHFQRQFSWIDTILKGIAYTYIYFNQPRLYKAVNYN